MIAAWIEIFEAWKQGQLFQQTVLLGLIMSALLIPVYVAVIEGEISLKRREEPPLLLSGRRTFKALK